MQKFGVREICNIVFKAKANGTKVGNAIFDEMEPIIYFDSAKTSSLEGTANAVYATGGRGNPKLITWEGEKSLTFTFEDALISPMSLAILAGAGLGADSYKHHVNFKVIAATDGADIVLDCTDKILEMYGEDALTKGFDADQKVKLLAMKLDGDTMDRSEKAIPMTQTKVAAVPGVGNNAGTPAKITLKPTGSATLVEDQVYMVDGYIVMDGTTVNIDADKFAGTFYIEAETLFRDTEGKDHPAQIVFPKAKPQSNWSIAMSNSGDPSTFTFTIDAMEDYLFNDKTTKRLVVMNILD